MPPGRKVPWSLRPLRKGAACLTCFVLLFMGASRPPPALANSSVVGSVTRSKDASVSGQALLTNTTIFSGDTLQVKDGVAVIVVGNNRLILGRDTTATFLRDTNGITVTLTQGNITAYYFPEGTSLRVEAGEVFITAAPGLKAVGEIAIVDGSTVITAKEGSLQVDNLGALQILPQGQTTVIGPKIKKRGGIIGAKTAIIAAGGIAAAAAIAAELELNKAQIAATCTPTPATASSASPTPPCP